MKQTTPPARRHPARTTGAPAVRLLCTVAVMAAGVGCATPGNRADPDEPQERLDEPVPVAAAPSPLSYTVAPGDALAAIAARFTGDAARWRAIAEHNGIEDPRRLVVGQRIEIPAEWLTASRRSAMAGGETPSSAADAPVATPSGGASLPDRGEPVIVSPVNANRRFELDPLQDPEGTAVQRQVRVVGTYYPVALYTEPRNGAPLARRVAPGSLFPLDRELDGWWQLDTGTGAAWLRRADGELATGRDATSTPKD